MSTPKNGPSGLIPPTPSRQDDDGTLQTCSQCGQQLSSLCADCEEKEQPFIAYDCWSCGFDQPLDKLRPNQDSLTGYKCSVCGNDANPVKLVAKSLKDIVSDLAMDNYKEGVKRGHAEAIAYLKGAIGEANVALSGIEAHFRGNDDDR